VTANIDPLQESAKASEPVPTPLHGARSAPSGGEFAAALSRAQRAPGLAAGPILATPPPELGAHIAAAARAWDALAAAGQSISFETSDAGKLRILLSDDGGNELVTLSGQQLFELIDREGGA
jgi:hypothetical protein